MIFYGKNMRVYISAELGAALIFPAGVQIIPGVGGAAV